MKSKVNAALQNASGSCAHCHLPATNGVTRACRVCGTVYCGVCKERYMEKSDNARLPKKRAWCCKQTSCREKGRIDGGPDPSTRPYAVGHSNTKYILAAEVPEKERRVTTVQGPACSLCHKAVHRSEMQKDSQDKPYHADCLVCFGCKKPLGGDPFNVLDASTSCFVKYQEPKPANAQATSSKSEGGDVAFTSVHEMIEVMGAELEAAIDGMIPRCEICGASFSANHVIIVVGTSKKHKECFQSGRAMHARSMTPRQAARAVPPLVTLRIFVNSKWFTFFLVRSPDSGNEISDAEDYAQLQFIVDPSARSAPTRQCPPPEDGSDAVIDCEGVGESRDFVLRGQLAYEDADDTLTAHITHAKYALDHDLAVKMLYDGGSLSLTLKGATLTIAYPPEEPVPMQRASQQEDHDADSLSSDDDAGCMEAVPMQSAIASPPPMEEQKMPEMEVPSVLVNVTSSRLSTLQIHSEDYDHSYGGEEEPESPSGSSAISDKVKKKRRQFKPSNS